MTLPRASLIAILMLTACKGGSGDSKSPPPATKTTEKPRITPELMPPGAEGLVLNVSTKEDILAKFPGAEEGTTNFNGVETVTVTSKKGPEGKTDAGFYLWKDDAGTPRMIRMTLYGAGRCDWVDKNIATQPTATDCIGNRKTGKSGNESLYCLASPDGKHEVRIECYGGSGELSYWLVRDTKL